jgi:serine/threonine-protein kinase
MHPVLHFLFLPKWDFLAKLSEFKVVAFVGSLRTSTQEQTIMKTKGFKLLLTAATFLVTSTLISTPAVKAESPSTETTPSIASTYQDGFWQPVARVNPELPIEIKFINQTGEAIEYGFTGNQNIPEKLSANETALLSNVSPDTHILISSSNPSNVGLAGNLKYDVAVTDNLVTVTIENQSDFITGDSALNIHRSGGIYIY